MKNLILIAAVMLFGTVGFAQIKVVGPSGDTKIGDTATAPAGKLHVDGGDVIFEGGNVGISTTSPSHLLHINAFEPNNTSLQVGGFGVQSLNPSQGFLIGNGYWQTGAGPQVNVNGGFSMLHFFSGKVALRTQQTATVGSTVVLKNTLTADGLGNVGIGTLNPSSKLDVQGNAFKTQGGDVWSIPSDKRLKKNINKFKKGLDIILDIETVDYEYNGKAGTTAGEYQIGVLAQDLQKVAPWMVKEATIVNAHIDENGKEQLDDSENILTINASSLKWMLVNAVKQQHTQIVNQQEKIETLESQLETLTMQVNKLVDLNQNNDSNSIYEEATEDIKNYQIKNYPNPFSKETTFEYFIADTYENAELLITTSDGKIVKQEKLIIGSNNSLLINNLAPNSAYYYSLVLNGSLSKTELLISK
jgi:hypothetical protein